MFERCLCPPRTDCTCSYLPPRGSCADNSRVRPNKAQQTERPDRFRYRFVVFTFRAVASAVGTRQLFAYFRARRVCTLTTRKLTRCLRSRLCFTNRVCSVIIVISYEVKWRTTLLCARPFSEQLVPLFRPGASVGYFGFAGDTPAALTHSW